jgi:hypothetical protein
MAHFAQLDENNVVTQVIVVSNSDCQINGVESEEAGIVFCKTLFGPTTRWKQTSYNANLRKNYAGIGFEYDPGRDAFIPPKPYASWVLNEQTCQWGAPVSMPADAGTGEPPKLYTWDESTISWVPLVVTP